MPTIRLFATPSSLKVSRMKREHRFFVRDMIEEIANIREFTQRMDYDSFEEDKKTIYAVVRSLEIIGEAVSKIPDDLKKQTPDIPWREIRTFRNITAHKYGGVDLQIVWDIIENQLDPLQTQLIALTEEYFQDG